MIACQIKVDGEWVTGLYVVDGAETVEETWRHRSGITEFRTYIANDEEVIEAPQWSIELRCHQSDKWKKLTYAPIPGDLRALLVLWGGLCKTRGTTHADWRIRPYEGET